MELVSLYSSPFVSHVSILTVVPCIWDKSCKPLYELLVDSFVESEVFQSWKQWRLRVVWASKVHFELALLKITGEL